MATNTNATNYFSPARWVVSKNLGEGTHTTIGSAITSASAGDTIVIMPATAYSENLTLTAGINLVAFPSDSSLNNTGNVQITGKLTFTGAGTVSISGIQLNTNSDFFLVVSGTNASIVNLNNCFLNCLNNTGISFAATNTSAKLNISFCFGNLGTTGIGLFSGASTGTLAIYQSNMTNSGASTTATTMSAGSWQIYNSTFNFPFSTTSTANMSVSNSLIDCSAINATALLVNGSGNGTAFSAYLASGTASGVSVGTGVTFNMQLCNIISSNTNAWTGAGTLNTFGNVFGGSSHLSNVTTQTGGAASGLTQGTAPSAGMIGEQIKATLGNASATSLTTNTPKTITSVSLTPGIWNVSALGTLVSTGTTSFTNQVVGVSTSNNTLGPTPSDDSAFANYNPPAVGVQTSLTVPSYRITLSATTNVYLVMQAVFTVSTCTAYGTITATRVG